jgi:hypothetical protein
MRVPGATAQTLGPRRRLQGYAPASLACIALVGKKGANNQYHDPRACIDEGLVAEANHGICELERYENARKPTQQCEPTQEGDQDRPIPPPVMMRANNGKTRDEQEHSRHHDESGLSSNLLHQTWKPTEIDER